MATKEEWREFFELTEGRQPTLEEFQAAKRAGEFAVGEDLQRKPNSQNQQFHQIAQKNSASSYLQVLTAASSGRMSLSSLATTAAVILLVRDFIFLFYQISQNYFGFTAGVFPLSLTSSAGLSSSYSTMSLAFFGRYYPFYSSYSSTSGDSFPGALVAVLLMIAVIWWRFYSAAQLKESNYKGWSIYFLVLAALTILSWLINGTLRYLGSMSIMQTLDFLVSLAACAIWVSIFVKSRGIK
ncbi:hypothetical protein [Lactovum odontotermitis]